jgi:hypothetical protein
VNDEFLLIERILNGTGKFLFVHLAMTQLARLFSQLLFDCPLHNLWNDLPILREI